MQILLLSLLVLLILIGQIYKIIKDKDKLSREAFDMVNKKKHQIEYWENTVRYYKSLGDKGFGDTISKIEKNDSVDNFLALDSNNILVETFHGESSRRDTETAIETCRSLTKCEQLDETIGSKCGYCGTTNKWDYDDGSGIAPDVCPTADASTGAKKYIYSADYETGSTHSPDEYRGNQWATTTYDCLKVQRQKTCDKIETCGGMMGEEGKMCGWCPSDSRAKVKTSGKNALLLYDGGNDAEANSKITSDKCPDMGKPNPDDPDNAPYFSELKKAGSCSVCDKAVVNAETGVSEARGNVGIHSRECLQSLWKASYTDASGTYNVACNTEFDSVKTADFGHYRNDGATGRKPYYKIAAEMRAKVKRPIVKFMKEYNESNAGGGPHWGLIGHSYRRSYDIDNLKDGKISVDKLWKKCFGENSKGNVDDDFGIK
jgi:hypothetical protein